MKFTFISFNMEHKAHKVHTFPLATAADTAPYQFSPHRQRAWEKYGGSGRGRPEARGSAHDQGPGG